MSSLEANLLVAIPQLPDANFCRTVVLVVQHDENGAFGLVLNRPSDIMLKDVWEQITQGSCECQLPINLGGPVDGPLIAIHTDETYSESEILPGVFFSTQKENLGAIVEQSEKPFKVFSGYSGWGQGQLEQELTAGGWLTAPASYGYIFHEHEDLWQTVAADIGQRIILPQINDRLIPADPSVN